MITYKTQHLVEKFLSDIEYQAQTDNVRVQQTKTSLCTGLRGVDWQIGGLRPGDVFLLIGGHERVNTAFLAFILHALCWKQQVPAHVYSCAEPVERWLPYLLSAELKMSVSSLRWGVEEHDLERVKTAGHVLQNLPLWFSDLNSVTAQRNDFEASAGQVLVVDDLPLKEMKESETFLQDLKQVAVQRQKIVLVSATLDEKMCQYPDIYSNLRSIGLLGHICDFVGLLNLRIPGQDDVIAVTKERTTLELIPLEPYAQDKITLRMLYNARLPGAYVTFLYNQFDVVDFRDEIK